MADLAPTSSGIIAEHSEIIEGVEKIYAQLIELGYVQNTDIQVPPHGAPKDPIYLVGLRQAGLDPQTIELIGRFPAFTNDVIHKHQKLSKSQNGIPIALDSAATCYLLGPGLGQDYRETGDAELLPSTALKIATATSPYGINLAYDLEHKPLIQWVFGQWGRREASPVAEYCEECEEWARALREDLSPSKTDGGWTIDIRKRG